MYVYLFRASTTLIRLKQLSQIWLLNCFEGSQHSLARKNIKIAQIKKIIITHDSSFSVNGLLGLLSTVSLSSEKCNIDIYGPSSLHKYVFWGRRYSKTGFRHKLHFYNVLDGSIVNRLNFYLHAFVCVHNSSCANYRLLGSECPGVFNCDHAKNYGVPFGSLYGSFKKGQDFILPDGFIFYSRNFIYGYHLGCAIALLTCTARKRDICTIKSAVYAIYD